MNMKILSIVLGVVLVLGVGTLVYTQKNNQPAVQPVTQDNTVIHIDGESANQKEAETSASTKTTTSQSSGITLNMVAAHDSRESCWTSINGNVYDVTSWIPNHPGGEKAILQLCGTDGSKKFNEQHGGAEKQAMILVGFKIGTLSN